MIPDKRATHRVSFERPITADMMAIDGTWRRACTLKDVSDTGAKLLVEGSVQGLPLKEFFLVLSSLGLGLSSLRAFAWVNGEQLGVTFIETNPKGGEPGRQCLPGRSEPAPVSRPGTMNLGTACADTWYRDFAISLPGLEAAACDHLSRRRFCFRSLCQAVSWSGSSVPECGRHRPPVLACSRTSLLDPGSPRPWMGLVEHVSLL
jgi:hypothetical protein